MPAGPEETAISKRAEALLRSGEIGSAVVRETGRIGAPIPVLTPERQRHSWFVPIAAGDRLAGFLQLLPDLTVLRYSSFQRREDRLDGCPPAELWIDTEKIRRVAQEKARPGETAGEPYLTYDRVPSRLVWAIPLSTTGGATRTLYIAGRAIWEARPGDEQMDFYGGGRASSAPGNATDTPTSGES